jgi:glutathione synthase/RimK-type ligase-like ATP-grasp enzyme
VLDALRLDHGQFWVAGADISPVRLHLSAADARMLIPRASSPEYIDRLREIVDRHRIDVVHVQPDPEVLVVGAARDDLGGAQTFLPSQEALDVAADKAIFAVAMARAAVPTAESVAFEAFSEIADAVGALLEHHERVWVRARRGAGSRASLPVSSSSQAEAWVKWWMAEKGMVASDFMASEMLPGREFAYQSVWQDGALVVGQTRERVEYLYGFLSPSGQSSTPAVARTVRSPEIDDLAQRAILALDERPHGIYCADMKTATDGVVKVTEINAGRFFTTSNFFAHAGVNMPAMAMRAAMGETLAPLGSSPLEPDLYWIRMVDMGFVLVHGSDLERWPVLDDEPATGHARTISP